VRHSPALSAAVRGAAAVTVGAAIVVPLVRRRLRVPAPLTVGVCAAGPLALAVLRRRSKKRDVSLFALQMWGFTMAHELPYDHPERLRARLRTRYPIAVDRLIGGGELPTLRAQRALAKLGRANLLDRALTWVHWLWFLEPYLALVWILARHNERFPRSARQMAATFDLGCVGYFAVPTAPPWWASEQGLMKGEVRRIMVEVGEETWGRAWPAMYRALGGNPWAAMPSLHFATSLMAALLLSEAGRAEGAVGWGYALSLGFALVYLGEHYVTDLAAGAALVAIVRRGEPHAEPYVRRVNWVVQRLERIAQA
jgi:membrane-associated phospholipid phosphatase